MLARKYAKIDLDQREELIQIGSFALLDAIQRFDKSTGNKLSTYAWYRIRGEMLSAVRKDKERSEFLVLGNAGNCGDYEVDPCDLDRDQMMRDVAKIAAKNLTEEQQTLLYSYADGRKLAEAAPGRTKPTSSRMRSNAARVVRAAIRE